MEPDGRNKKGRMIPALITLLIVALVGAGIWAYRQYVDTYHFAVVEPGVLYRDGNRTMREFKTALRKGKIRTVVMLNDDGELARKPQFNAEIEYCAQRGIKVERVAVPIGESPDSDEVRRFLDIATRKENQPVLVHCAQGVRRTAMMVAAFQQSVLNYDDDAATNAIMPWGRKWENLDDIRTFIKAYDPATRQVDPTLVPSRIDDID